MRSRYYKIPLNTSELFKRKDVKPKLYVSLKDSLIQHLELLFLTSFQELRYDHNYGSIISELDFSNDKQTGIFEKTVQNSLLEALERFEPRLNKLNIKVNYDKGGEVIKSGDSTNFRVYIVIRVRANIKQLNEPFEHLFKIFFSPLSET